jgi:hypothetical protein
VYERGCAFLGAWSWAAAGPVAQPPERQGLAYIGGVGVGAGVGIVRGVAGVPLVGTQGCVTVLVPTAVPGLLRLVLPITVLAPPTVPPTAGIPVVALVPVAGVPPAAVVPAPLVVVVVPGTVPGPHGPATVLMVEPTVLFGAPGRAPTWLEVTAGTPPAVAGALTAFWLGVVVVL